MVVFSIPLHIKKMIGFSASKRTFQNNEITSELELILMLRQMKNLPLSLISVCSTRCKIWMLSQQTTSGNSGRLKKFTQPACEEEKASSDESKNEDGAAPFKAHLILHLCMKIQKLLKKLNA